MIDDLRRGQANYAITNVFIAIVDILLWKDKKVTMEELAGKVRISVGSMHIFIWGCPKYRKICMQWIPHNLESVQKDIYIGMVLEYLLQYHKVIVSLTESLQEIKCDTFLINQKAKEKTNGSTCHLYH